MTRISRAGVEVEVPTGWEAEMTDRPGQGVVLHLSNAPLPPKRSDFGGDALRELRDKVIFVSILEYDPADADKGLYRMNRLPTFVPGDFAPNRLHRELPGQTGAQKFFSFRGRTFCCYVVIARDFPAVADTARVNSLLRTLSVRLNRGSGRGSAPPPPPVS